MTNTCFTFGDPLPVTGAAADGGWLLRLWWPSIVGTLAETLDASGHGTVYVPSGPAGVTT